MIVLHAEIIEIGGCLDIIIERNYQKCDIAINSDSQSEVKALKSYVIDSKLIKDYRRKLKEAGKKNKV